ncbi:glycosyltransferase family 61 protein [Adhaeribacter rhizoryzae]|uniref:Glycosyltransferase family 61 protein n=1 Tax=Adhaeribacter rhizoryzae TaxID=2607907 RepID=A0A5M6DHM0_9BACT|nr:glycosyltransferase family 61 protein [Adhaeribacter rhizoryzae]KAA5544765.1 glycosyltransferase family 61 protein [Adhaeribacter rhizoryzae]
MRLKIIYQKLSSWLNYYYSFTSVYQHPQKKVMQPGYWVEFSQPEKEFLNICAASFGYEVDYARGYRQKEIAVITLKDVIFLGNSGALIWQNKVIKESVFDQLRLTKSPAFRSPAYMLPQNKSGQFTSLMHLPWAETSNYHWFLDCLPRLYAILQNLKEPTTLIIPANMPAFQLETLNFLLLHNSLLSLQIISKNQKWQVPTFILPTFISNHYSGFLPPAISDFMRNGIWQGNGVKDEPVKGRIYISRAKASKRRLLQEEAVLEILKAHNFKIVYAEALTYAQQVQLFYNAEIIVGAHGAGLTNILFSKQAQLIELHPANQVRSHYFMVCKALGFNYHYLLGSNSNASQDFSINPAALKILLQTLLENTKPGLPEV